MLVSTLLEILAVVTVVGHTARRARVSTLLEILADLFIGRLDELFVVDCVSTLLEILDMRTTWRTFPTADTSSFNPS